MTKICFFLTCIYIINNFNLFNNEIHSPFFTFVICLTLILFSRLNWLDEEYIEDYLLNIGLSNKFIPLNI